MRRLLDENLSPRLATSLGLGDLYPGSAHVTAHDLGQAPDDAVWAFAREHGYTLVTKDSDFHELSLIRGTPPKVVWIRRGNCSTNQIEAILRRHEVDIQCLERDPEASFLLLY
jgi:predicted nuclease of predicted toxin-antitoxin system